MIRCVGFGNTELWVQILIPVISKGVLKSLRTSVFSSIKRANDTSPEG